jgi:hypothetical protein
MSGYVQLNSTTNNYSSNSWTVLTDIEIRIKEKIEKVGIPLKDWDIQINYGIKTGFNDAFIIDGEKRKELIEKHPKSEEIIRPILRGRDIGKYGYEFADLWLINAHNGIKEDGLKSININEYPAIKRHLDNHFSALEKRADQGDTPYNLRNCAYLNNLYKQKIIWKRVGSILRFCFDEKGCMALDSTCFATGNYLKYIIAVLNSKMGSYMLQDSPKTGTGDLLISVQAVEPILIPKISEEEETHFNHLVDKIILSQLKGESTKVIEAEIDKLVYSLYCLNIDEVEFIEN